MPYRVPHPFAPLRLGGTPLSELIDRHAHLVAVGLANCRAAQALHKEITRRQVEQRNAELDPPRRSDAKAGTKNSRPETQRALSNDDDQSHYNPLERRDPDTGRWTTGGTNSPPNPSVAAQVKGSPLKFGFGLNEGLQHVASSIAQGMAQASDPGPLKHDFRTFLRAQDRALAMVPNLHINFLTGEVTGDDTYERAMSQMIEERELARERLRRPWESFSAAAAEEADEFGHLKDNAPGPKFVGTAGVQSGQFLGYAAPSAIPYAGEFAGPLLAGLGSTGETFNQAFEAYKQAGLSDEEAREKAREVALNTGLTTAMIFALPIGRLASLPKSALTQLLLRMGINGAQMSADDLQSLLWARATYNPNLTLGDIAKETGNSFLIGALSGALPGTRKLTPEELARYKSVPDHGPDTPRPEAPNNNVTLKPPPQPLSPAERQALDQDIQARKPINMDTIVRANITGNLPLPKGYELDVLNNRFIYTGLNATGAVGVTQQKTPTQPSEPHQDQTAHSTSDDGLLPSLQGNIPNSAKRIPKGYLVSYFPDGSMKVTNPKGVSVKYNALGFPDFSPYLYRGTDGLAQVRIRLTGDRIKDEAAANAAAGFSETKEHYTWHHNEDTGLMQLVEKKVHDEFSHLGGFSINKNSKPQ